jgi:hypothetical protein
MKKRLIVGLVGAGLLFSMLPGVTIAAGKDSVTGTATFSTLDDSRAWVNAHSDADGTNPWGTYRIDIVSGGLTLEAEVVCLHVAGTGAVVGAVVTSSSDGTEVPVGTGLLHFVRDNGAPGTSDTSVTILDLDASLCASFVPEDAPLQPVQSGNWVVKDK